MSFITQPLSSLFGGASSAVGAAGAIQQGNANAQAADYNAAVARQNSDIAMQQGVAASEAQKRDAERKIGSMIANYGASGVSAGSGSPLDVLADSAAMSTLDNLTVKYNYALKAAGFTNQATLAGMQAKNARTSGILNASAFGLKGIGQFASMMGTSIPGFGSASGASDMAVTSDFLSADFGSYAASAAGADFAGDAAFAAFLL